MSKKVLAITNNFPTPRFPEKGVFVLNILQEMSRQGVEVDVIAPISIGTELKRLKRLPVKNNFKGLNVSQPYFFSIPQRLGRFKKTIAWINDFLFGLSLRFSYKSKKYDFVYTHFLQSAIPVMLYLPFNNIPILVNLGESDPWDYELFYSKHRLLSFLNRLSYIVTVSKTNFDYVLSLDENLSQRMRYIPNGVNIDVFKPYDRILSRQKLGLDLDTKYIVFCGHFDERKGPLRVLEAIKDTEIKGIFLGSNGPDTPVGKEVTFAGAVNNKDVVYYLSSCDAFVLPSRSEGMSNAVLEAMACCAPLVISNKPFNTDFIQTNSAIFIDPDDISDIKSGIEKALQPEINDSLRENLSKNRFNISIEMRIKKIFDFVDN